MINNYLIPSMIGQNLSSGPSIKGLTWSTTVGTTNRSYFPAYGLYDYSVYMSIFLQSELDSGIEVLTGLEVQLGSYSTNYTYYNFTVKVAHTNSSSIGSYSVYPNLSGLTTSDITTVKNEFDWTVSNGWNTINFDTNFEWNGTDNIVVLYENRDGSWDSGYGHGESHSPGSYLSGYKYQDSSYPTGTVTRNSSRLNTKLKY